MDLSSSSVVLFVTAMELMEMLTAVLCFNPLFHSQYECELMGYIYSNSLRTWTSRSYI